MSEQIEVPFELVQEWFTEWVEDLNACTDSCVYVANRAAQWAADQELEACCEWLQSKVSDDCFPGDLRTARRPKPPSLKQQALQILTDIEHGADSRPDDYNTIRRALEALPDD
jgi:hypothetical protein